MCVHVCVCVRACVHVSVCVCRQASRSRATLSCDSSYFVLVEQENIINLLPRLIICCFVAGKLSESEEEQEIETEEVPVEFDQTETAYYDNEAVEQYQVLEYEAHLEKIGLQSL